MKKMAKQAKKIASLEDALARQGKNAKSEMLYRVEPSDGVHVTAKANAVYAHLLATHLLRTVLPQRAVY